VLAPTRELALQVAKAGSDYGKSLNVSILAVYGGQPYSRSSAGSGKRGYVVAHPDVYWICSIREPLI